MVEKPSIAAQLPDALSVAVEKSSRLMAEDLCREAGFMLPQSGNTKVFLETIKSYPGVPVDAVESLLHTIHFNEERSENKMEKWKCTVCGYIHESPMTPDFKCPICKQALHCIASNSLTSTMSNHCFVKNGGF